MKLFKKAMAIAMAGVLALSMVACAPKTPDPVDPGTVAPASTVENEIVSTMETYRQVANGQVKPAAVLVDETNHKILEAVVELLQADPNSNKLSAYWGNEGQVSVSLKNIVSKLQYKGIRMDEESLKTVLSTGFYTIGDDEFVAVTVEKVKEEVTEDDDTVANELNSLVFKKTETVNNFNGKMVHKAYNVLAYAAYNAGVATSPKTAAVETTTGFGKLTLVYSSVDLAVEVPADFINGANPAIPTT